MLARPIQSTKRAQILHQPAAWTPAALAEIGEQFEQQSAEKLLAWAIRHFDGKLALATSFGPQSIVLAHMLSQMSGDVTIFYIDTGLLFAETYALRDRLQARLGLVFERVSAALSLSEQAQRFGPDLWQNDPNACCYVRKVLPLRQTLAKHDAWITGVRREQAATRAAAGLVEWDHTNQLVKFNPLANWKKPEVWAYIKAHDLPYNALHDQGFPSIGCFPCTKKVEANEDERSGRWAGLAKTECGLHKPAESTLSLPMLAHEPTKL